MKLNNYFIELIDLLILFSEFIMVSFFLMIVSSSLGFGWKYLLIGSVCMSILFWRLIRFKFDMIKK